MLYATLKSLCLIAGLTAPLAGQRVQCKIPRDSAHVTIRAGMAAGPVRDSSASARLVVRVLGNADASPLLGSWVVLHREHPLEFATLQAQAHSDTLGLADLAVVPVRSYLLRIRALAHVDFVREVWARAGASDTIEVRLQFLPWHC